MGSGTQDILFTNGRLDFYSKLVMPAPTRLFAARIRKARKDVFCEGYTMGGGAISGALIDHAEKYRVVMTPDAARTVRDDLDQVRALGLEVGDERDLKKPYLKLTLRDVDMPAFRGAFERLNHPLPPRLTVAVAVQDHGVAPKGMSDRQYRFGQFGKKIKNGATFEDFIFTRKTPAFSRVTAVIKSLNDEGYRDVLVMDTKMAGLAGGLYGEPLPAVAVDVGNGHTTAASVAGDGTIVGVFEAHTSDLTPPKLALYVKKLAGGTLTNEEIFDAGGHGAYVKEAVTPKVIVATGPRRDMALET
ncbi:MAG TPA: DUF1786 domain-containing protein, partial [Methanocella sp.]|nr:DUF1786 domain-containing protein [Methanocella sp.]